MIAKLTHFVMSATAVILSAIYRVLGLERICKPYLYENCDDIPSTVRYCLILGAKLFEDDSITPLLTRRLEAAVELYKKRPDIIFILSGDGSKRISDDTKAMHAYLKQHCDIPDDQILIDKKGYTTLDSMKNISPETDAAGFILLTSPVHMTRCVYICHRLGLHPYAWVLPRKGSKFQRRLEFRENLALSKAWYMLTFGTPASGNVLHRFGLHLFLFMGKALALGTRLLRRKSSFPGKLTLYLCPSMLEALTAPISMTLITGACEKSALCESVKNTLRASDAKVISNPREEGSISEIATILLRHTPLFGKPQNLHAVFKCSEADFYRIAKRCKSNRNQIYVTGLSDDKPEFNLNRILTGIDYLPDAPVFLNASRPELKPICDQVENPIQFYDPARN